MQGARPEISAAVWRDGGRRVGALASFFFLFLFLKGRSPGIAWRLAAQVFVAGTVPYFLCGTYGRRRQGKRGMRAEVTYSRSLPCTSTLPAILVLELGRIKEDQWITIRAVATGVRRTNGHAAGRQKLACS
jgi:hypothetical protein